MYTCDSHTGQGTTPTRRRGSSGSDGTCIQSPLAFAWSRVPLRMITNCGFRGPHSHPNATYEFATMTSVIASDATMSATPTRRRLAPSLRIVASPYHTRPYTRPVCIVLYIAADRHLPAVETPHLTISPLSPASYEHTRLAPHLQLPHLHTAGSCSGCGCGFQNNPHGLEPHDPDAAESQRELAAYLNARLDDHASMQLSICWAGEEHNAPRHLAPLNPAAIGRDLFRFDPRSLFTISRP